MNNEASLQDRQKRTEQLLQIARRMVVDPEFNEHEWAPQPYDIISDGLSEDEKAIFKEIRSILHREWLSANEQTLADGWIVVTTPAGFSGMGESLRDAVEDLRHTSVKWVSAELIFARRY